MNLLLTLAFAAAVPAAPVPDAPKGQPIDIAKSFELGPLAESFTLVSADYSFDRERGGGGLLTLKLEAKKDVDQASLRLNAAGFFDDENTLQHTSAVRVLNPFPLQKGERMVFSISTGAEDKKWNRIAIRKVDSVTSPAFDRPATTTTRPGAFGRGGAGGGAGGGGGGGGGTVPPPNPNDR